MRIMKKKIFTGLKILGILFFLLVISFFIFRKSIYNYALSKVQDKFKNKYNAQLKVGSLDSEGLAGFVVQDIALIPEKKDTLFVAKEIKGGIKIFKLLTGKVRFAYLTIRDGKIKANAKSDQNNFSFLLKGKSESTNEKPERNYAALVNKLVSAAFSNIPDLIEFDNNQLLFLDETGDYLFTFPTFQFNHSKVHGEVVVENKKKDKWLIDGLINKGKENFEGKIYGQSVPVVLPYLNEKYKFQCQFDTLYFALKNKDFVDDSLRLEGEVFFHNLFLKHPKLDSNAVVIKYVDADYAFDFGKNSASFSSSKIWLNKIPLEMKTGFSKEGKGFYFLQAKMNKVASQDFFNSLPEGLFSTFEGLQCEGTLEYNLNFALDVAKPDCVLFDSKLSDQGFRIKRYGAADFSKMNGPFLYTAYEKGKPVKSFIVGPENPEFTPLDQISPYLRSAVMQSEDGSFFVHNGFREDAFRMAIADNVKKGKFARGGSTISMQLVKNVFLSRKKTIARKIEEAIIVWMIEHKRLTSKERMYEVYLNIIEWGPGIYGIAEASQFYFSKKPADLTIEESIFLASIIPRPKGFKWSFDENGNLKSYLESYFRRMAELMTRREVITEEQKAAVVANVKLTGPAKNFVITSDSTDMDDSEDEDLFGEEEDDKRFFFFRKKKSDDKGELKEKKSSRKNESAVKVEENKSEEKTEKKKKKWSLFK
jgi:hypothetical protein